MKSTAALTDLRILAHDGTDHFSYAKVDLLDQGNGLLVYDYVTGEKLSRHSNGNVFTRIPGSGTYPPPTTTVPFSQIQHEIVRRVAIPSTATHQLPRYTGDPSDAFVFSSTVLRSDGWFAAEVVDDAQLQATLAAWRAQPDYVSAQTWRPTGTGKTVVLTVLNQRST